MSKEFLSITSFVCILAGLITSCVGQLSNPVMQESAPLTFTASMGDGDATKTALAEDGTSILWQPNDDINAFYGSTRVGRYTNYSDEAVSVAVFEGDGKSFVGATEDNGTKKNYWAIYPYAYKNSSDGQSVTAVIPDFQTATANNFAKGTLLTIAKSETTALQFYHVLGGIKFSVTHEGIRLVELTGNNNENLAGQVTITMDDGDRPLITSVTSPQKTIQLAAPDGETFQIGKWYYISCAPVAFSQGFTLTLRSDSETGIYSHSGPVEVKRAIWSSLSNVDDAVSYMSAANSIEYPAPTEILYTSTTGYPILVPDADAFESEIVENFYADGLGHLVFNEGITSFGKIGGYTGNPTLKTMILPYGIKRIEKDAFFRSESLVHVDIPASVVEIGANAFGESGLFSISIPEGITDISEHLFFNCVYLSEVELPTTIVSIGQGAFSNCRSLRSIVIPESCLSIQSGAFSGSSALGEISIPESCVVMEGAFTGCGKLKRFNSSKASADGRCLFEGDKLVALATCGLEEYEIPEGVVRIGSSALSSNAPHRLVIPASVTVIADSFSFLSETDQLIIKNTTPPELEEYVWIGNCQIYVPAESVETYKAAPRWSEFAERIHPIPAG